MAGHYKSARILVPKHDVKAVEAALELAMVAAGYAQKAEGEASSTKGARRDETGERMTLFRGDGSVLVSVPGALASALALVLSTALETKVELIVAEGMALGREVTVTMRKLVVERGKATEEPLDTDPFEHECSDREMTVLPDVIAEATEQVIGAHPFPNDLVSARSLVYARAVAVLELPQRVQRVVDQLATAAWFSVGEEKGQTVVRGLLAGDVRLTTFLKPDERKAFDAAMDARPELRAKQRDAT